VQAPELAHLINRARLSSLEPLNHLLTLLRLCTSCCKVWGWSGAFCPGHGRLVVYEYPLLVVPTVDVLALEEHDKVAGAGCATLPRIFGQSHCVRQSAVPM
jgi:hypothetical protein